MPPDMRSRGLGSGSGRRTGTASSFILASSSLYVSPLTIYPSVKEFLTLFVGISAYIAWENVRHIPQNKYCLIMDDHFAELDTKVWSHEVQLNGFGFVALRLSFSPPTWQSLG